MRGSTVALSDETGSITDRFEYGSYGELLNHTGATDTHFLYDGRDGVMTDKNGLYYMRARYYNPEIKRFLSEDTFEDKYQDLLNINLFQFANNNPVMNIDPTGNYSIALYFIPGIGQYFLGVTVIAGVTYLGYKAGTYLGEKAKAYFSKEDPYARPGQKKQGRERKEKKKGNDKKWRSNSNKRKEPLKKHTPSKEHQKYPQ